MIKLPGTAARDALSKPGLRTRHSVVVTGAVSRNWLASAFLVLAMNGLAVANTAVTLQLKWSHSFRFAGYYAALDQGYYRQAGIDVHIEEAMPGVDSIEQVLSGEADFGVSNNNLLMARAAGAPVVVLALIFQHSPQVIIARERYAAQSLPDLVDKQVMFAPRSAGMDFYGDNLFTSAQQIERHPELVKAFREASLRGWQYALEHPDAVAHLIQEKYRAQHDLGFYRFQYEQMIPLVDQDLVEIGHMSPGRWQRIADVYTDLGRLPRNLPLEGFLYDPAPTINLEKFWLAFSAVLAMFVISGLVALHLHRVRRRLVDRVATLQNRWAALSESETCLRKLVEASAAGVCALRDGKFVMVNPALMALSGYSEAELLAMRLEDLIHAEHKSVTMEYFAARLCGKSVQPNHEFMMHTKNGTTRWAELTVNCCTLGDESASVGTVYDITEYKLIEEQIKHMAQIDELTGLANLNLFIDRFTHALVYAKRDRYQLGLLYIDLNLEKLMPDLGSLGEAAADSVVKEAAKRLKDCIRDSDTAARIDQDKFMVLLRAIEETQNAVAVAQLIEQDLGRRMKIDDCPLHICASIGVAIYPEHGSDEMELIRNAESALSGASEMDEVHIHMFDYEDEHN